MQLTPTQVLAGSLDVQQEASIRQQVQELSLDIKYMQREQQAMEVDMAVLKNAFEQVAVSCRAPCSRARWISCCTPLLQKETDSKDMDEALEKFLAEADVQFEKARGIAEQRGELRQALLQLESLHMTISAEQQARAEAQELSYQELEVMQEYLVRLQQQTEVEEAVKAVAEAAISTCEPLVLALFKTSGAERTIFDEALHHIVLARKAERPRAVDLDDMDADAALAESQAAAVRARLGSDAQSDGSKSPPTRVEQKIQDDSDDDVGFFLTAVEEPTAERSHSPGRARDSKQADDAAAAAAHGGVDQDSAATRIQAQWRGAQVRKGGDALGTTPAAPAPGASGSSATQSTSKQHSAASSPLPQSISAAKSVEAPRDDLPSLHVQPSLAGSSSLDVVAMLMSPAMDGSGRKRIPRRLSVGAPSSRQRRMSTDTETTAEGGADGGHSQSNGSGNSPVRRSVEHEGVTLTYADLSTARQYALTQIKLLESQGVNVDTIGSYLALVELRLVRLLDALAQAVGVQAPRQFKQLVNDALTAHDSDGPQPSLSRLLSAGVASPHFRGPDTSPGKPTAEEAAREGVQAANAAVLRVDKQRLDSESAVSRAGELTLGGMRQGVGGDLQLWLASQKQQSYGGRQGRLRRKAEERAKSQPRSRTGSADARMRGQIAVAGGVPSKRTLGAASAHGNSAVTPYFAGYEALEEEPSTAQMLNAAGLGVTGVHVKAGVLQHSPLIDSHPLAGADGRVINATDSALPRSFNVIPPEMPQLSGQKQRDAHYLLRLSQLAGLPLSPRTLKRTLEGATGGVVVGGLHGVRAAMKAMTADNFVAGRSSQAEDIGRNLAMAGIALEDDEEALPQLKQSGGGAAAQGGARRAGGARAGMLQTFTSGDFSANSAAESGMDIGTSLRALLLSPAKSTAGAEQVGGGRKHPGSRNRRGSAGSRASAGSEQFRGVDLEASYFDLPSTHAARPDTAQSENSVPDIPQTAEDILAEFQALRQLDGSGVAKGLGKGAEMQRMGHTARSSMRRSGGKGAVDTDKQRTHDSTTVAGEVARDMAAARLRSPERHSGTRASHPALPLAAPTRTGEEAMVDAAAMLPPSRAPATHSAVKLTPLGVARARLQASTAAVPESLRQRAAQQAFLTPSESPVASPQDRARSKSPAGRRRSAVEGDRPHSSSSHSARHGLGASESAPALRGGGSSASKRGPALGGAKRNERAAWEEVKGLQDMDDLSPNIAAAVGIPVRNAGGMTAWRAAQASRGKAHSPLQQPQDEVSEPHEVFQRVELPERGLAHVPRELSGTARVRPMSAAHRLRSVIDPSGRSATSVHSKWAPEAVEKYRPPKSESLQQEVEAEMRSVPLGSGTAAADMDALLSQVTLDGFQKPAAVKGRRASTKSERSPGSKPAGGSSSVPRLAPLEGSPQTAFSAAPTKSAPAPSPVQTPQQNLSSTAPAASTAFSPVTPAKQADAHAATQTLPRNVKVSQPDGRLKVTAPHRSSASRPWASPPKSWAQAHGREAHQAGDVPIRIAGVPGLGSVMVGTGAAAASSRSKSASPNRAGSPDSAGAGQSPAMPIGAARLSPLSNAQFPVGFDDLMRDVEAQYTGEGGVKAFVVAGDLDPETLRKREAERKAATAEAARRAALEQTVSESTKRAVSRWKEVGITVRARRKSSAGATPQGKTEKAFQGAAAAAATGWDGLLKTPGGPRQLASLLKNKQQQQQQQQQRPATSHGTSSPAAASTPSQSPVRSSMSAHARVRPAASTPQQSTHDDKRQQHTLAGGTKKASRVKTPAGSSKDAHSAAPGKSDDQHGESTASKSEKRKHELSRTAPARTSSPVDKALQEQVKEVAVLPGSHTKVKRTRRSSIGSPYKGVVVTKPPLRRSALGQVRKPRRGGGRDAFASPFDSALDQQLRADEMGEDTSAGGSTGGAGGFTSETLTRQDLAAALGSAPADGAGDDGRPEKLVASATRNQSRNSQQSSHGALSQRSRPSLAQSSPLIQSLTSGSRVSSRAGARGRKLSPIASTRPGSLATGGAADTSDFEVSSTGAVGTNAASLGAVRFSEATPTHSAMRAAARKQRTSPRDTLEATVETSDDKTINSTRVQGAATVVGR